MNMVTPHFDQVAPSEEGVGAHDVPGSLISGDTVARRRTQKVCKVTSGVGPRELAEEPPRTHRQDNIPVEVFTAPNWCNEIHTL